MDDTQLIIILIIMPIYAVMMLYSACQCRSWPTDVMPWPETKKEFVDAVVKHVHEEYGIKPRLDTMDEMWDKYCDRHQNVWDCAFYVYCDTLGEEGIAKKLSEPRESKSAKRKRLSEFKKSLV